MPISEGILNIMPGMGYMKRNIHLQRLTDLQTLGICSNDECMSILQVSVTELFLNREGEKPGKIKRLAKTQN